MSAQYTERLPTIKALKNALTSPSLFNKTLSGAGSAVRGEIIKSWLSGKGANGASLNNPPITQNYADLKKKAGMNPRIDLTLSGNLTKSFQVQKPKNFSVSIRFTGASLSPILTKKGVAGRRQKDNVKVARSLVDRRPQIMTIGNKLKKTARDAFLNLLRKNAGLK